MSAATHTLPEQTIRGERRAPEISDAALLVAAQRDPAESVAIYDRYFARVYGYVRLRVDNHPTCEDITSQVFTTALARIHTLRPDGNVGAWLFTVAQNAVHDAYRAQQRTIAGESELGTLTDPDPGVEEQVLDAERASELQASLSTLRPDQQNLLALRYGADLSFPQIARIVGRNPIAVRVSVHRILAQLRRRNPHER